jgi:hypothetical protein
LGRPLSPEDFANASTDRSDPEDQPIQWEDYGIYDLLTPEMLHAIDSAVVKFVSQRPRKVNAIVVYMCDESYPGAIPGLSDLFYMDRIVQLIDEDRLIVVAEGRDLRFDVVRRRLGYRPVKTSRFAKTPRSLGHK